MVVIVVHDAAEQLSHQALAVVVENEEVGRLAVALQLHVELEDIRHSLVAGDALRSLFVVSHLVVVHVL